MPKTATKTTKKTIKKSTPKPYFIKVKFNDEEFETKATSLYKALKEFVNDKSFTSGIKTRVILTYGNKNVTRNAIYSVQRARRMFSMFKVKEDNAIEIFANQLTRALI